VGKIPELVLPFQPRFKPLVYFWRGAARPSGRMETKIKDNSKIEGLRHESAGLLISKNLDTGCKQVPSLFHMYTNQVSTVGSWIHSKISSSIQATRIIPRTSPKLSLLVRTIKLKLIIDAFWLGPIPAN